MPIRESKPGTLSGAKALGRSNLWETFVFYWSGGEPERANFAASRHALEDDDFSAEHGYQPGFEGRSEFEHGEFERWI
ncbi:MAG: hypothetical protein ABI895_15500 [Deltaproteobacteria bacterium]